MTRRTPWILIPALLLATPAWAEWHESDFNNAFAKVHKEIARLADEVAKQDRITVRRVSDLERTVRELRTTLRRLETQLKDTNHTIASLRTDLKRTAKAARSTGAKTGFADGSGAGSGQANEPVAEIVGERRTVSGDFITLTGMVHNISTKPLSFISVRATFLDTKGNTVKSEVTYTSPRVISAGARASFKFVTRYDRRIRRHRLSVQTK